MHSTNPSPIDSFPLDIQTAIFHFWQYAAFHGKKKCRKHGVGAFREFLGRGNPENVVPFKGEARRLKDPEQQWRAALAHVCQHCGECRWARRAS